MDRQTVLLCQVFQLRRLADVPLESGSFAAAIPAGSRIFLPSIFAASGLWVCRDTHPGYNAAALLPARQGEETLR